MHRAGLGLAALTRADKSAALAALQCRGSNFRAMQDPLAALVAAPTARQTGSPNERRGPWGGGVEQFTQQHGPGPGTARRHSDAV